MAILESLKEYEKLFGERKMKKMNLGKQLKTELREYAPNDFSAVLQKCETCNPTPQSQGNVAIKTIDSRCIIALSLVAVTVLSLLFLWFFGVFSSKQNLPIGKGSFVIDINPSIEISYDERGGVTAAKGLNEDGKALLVGLTLTGDSYETATEKIFTRCVAMGYFSAKREDNALLTTATTEKGEKDERMTGFVKDLFLDEFSKRKIRGVVIDGVYNVDLQEKADEYGISAQKYGMILIYLENGGTLKESAYSTITMRELYAKLEKQELAKKTAKASEIAKVLSSFEKKLHQTLSEQIQTLFETLDVYLSVKTNDTESIHANIMQSIEKLKHASTKSERETSMEEIMTSLDKLKSLQTEETMLSLIDGAKMTIQVTYDFFERAFDVLLIVWASPEEINAMRLEKFSSYGDGTQEFDEWSWQNERVEEVSKNWFSLKDSWKKAREKDFC